MLEPWDDTPRERGVFCNRTLNLRSIEAIGYDMDYTLVHYNVKAWEGRAYQHIKQRLVKEKWPVKKLRFQSDLVMRGLIIDKQLGNVVKANRFGYVKAGMHGTNPIPHEELKKIYSRTIIDLAEPRYFFLNSLFSISEACIYCQLVDLLDQGEIPGVMGYETLYSHVRHTLDLAHLEGQLKAEIMDKPEKYVELDPEVPLTLLDQKEAGKIMLLITNSGWKYTKFMMKYAFDRYLPKKMTWRDLFNVVVVESRKPAFFTDNAPIFKVVDEEGSLKPCPGGFKEEGVYHGGNAGLVEKYLGLSGGEILYVGDHIYSDVSVSKKLLRWRTAVIVRELEEELKAIERTRSSQTSIAAFMQEKEKLEDQYSQYRLQLQRLNKSYGPQVETSPRTLKSRMKKIRGKLLQIDSMLGPLLIEDGKAFNHNWGFLMRAGNDKGRITRQVENHADIYTSRVSNMLRYTPFMYFRSPRKSLPHDMGK